MDTTKESPVVLSLCTGVRGLERGIERALGHPLRVAAYSEIEAFIMANLIAGMEAGILDPAPIWANLKTFPFQEFHNRVHGIIGGYPCQPFSVAGQQKGESDPRHLWPYIKTGIQAVRPAWCFFENVPGHLNIGYETVRRDLQEMGYHVEEGIFSAEEVGAPHQRKRLFILALLGYPKSDYQWREWFGKGRLQGAPGGSSIELANAHSNGYGGNNKAGFQSKIIRSCKVANANNQRLQGWERRELSECPSKCTARPSSAWPARPGEEQHEWEESRVIKPGLGCTIDGYNFREDLLRALGNGVVEQTAELAFRELIIKHEKSRQTTNPTGDNKILKS